MPNLPLLVVVLSWGFNFVAVKVVYREMTAPALSLVRFAVMYVMLVALCGIQGHSIRYRKDWPKVITAGALSMGVYMVLFLEGMRFTTPAEGAIVLAMAPLITFFLACLLKQEAFSWEALAGSVVAFVGVSMVVFGEGAGGHGSLLGNLLVFASAVAWAVAAVYMRPILSSYEPAQFFTMSMPGALIVLLPYGWGALMKTNLHAITPYAWLMFAQMAVMSGVIAFACFYAGIKQVGAARATMYQFFVPPCAALSAWWVLGKTLAWMQVVGMAVVLVGVLYASWARMKRAEALVLSEQAEGPKVN